MRAPPPPSPPRLPLPYPPSSVPAHTSPPPVAASAILAHYLLHERLNVFGALGCVLCISGSVTIVLHAPDEQPLVSVLQVWELAMQPGELAPHPSGSGVVATRAAALLPPPPRPAAPQPHPPPAHAPKHARTHPPPPLPLPRPPPAPPRPTPARICAVRLLRAGSHALPHLRAEPRGAERQPARLRRHLLHRGLALRSVLTQRVCA